MKKYDSTTEIPIELIQLWETAWKAQPTRDKPIELAFPSHAEMVTFRQHAYKARQKLLRESYPGAQNFTKLGFFEISDTKLGLCLPSWFSAVQKVLTEHGVEPMEQASDEAEGLPEESANLSAVQELFKNPMEKP